MTIALLVTISVIILLSLVVLIFVYRKKDKIPCMTGMMISMTLGMMVGLDFGVIFGIIYQGNLFTSTLLSMAVGMITGFLAGAPISIMAVLDGMLSGLMGGMMGAMLGEMVTTGFQDMMIKIMFVVFIGIVLILLFMMQEELIRKNQNGSNRLNHNPLFMMMILGVFFFGYNQLGSTVTTVENHNHEKSQHKGQQSNQVDPSEESNTNNITILAKDFVFLPNQIHILKGEPVTLILSNQGMVEHDIEILDLDSDIQDSVLSKGAKHHSNGNAVRIHVVPSEEQKMTFIPKKSGLYKMVCKIHKGMYGWVKVG